MFCDNFAVTHCLQKFSINIEAIQILCRMRVFYAEKNIEVQAHRILIKQNSLADTLSHGHYIKIADRCLFIQVAKSTFETSLIAVI